MNTIFCCVAAKLRVWFEHAHVKNAASSMIHGAVAAR